MSEDWTTEVLKYLSAIAREVGEFRQETNAHFDRIEVRLDKVEGRLDKVEGRLGNIEREQRHATQRLDRIEGFPLITRSDIGELKDSVHALEDKQP